MPYFRSDISSNSVWNSSSPELQGNKATTIWLLPPDKIVSCLYLLKGWHWDKHYQNHLQQQLQRWNIAPTFLLRCETALTLTSLRFLYLQIGRILAATQLLSREDSVAGRLLLSCFGFLRILLASTSSWELLVEHVLKLQSKGRDSHTENSSERGSQKIQYWSWADYPFTCIFVVLVLKGHIWPTESNTEPCSTLKSNIYFSKN